MVLGIVYGRSGTERLALYLPQDRALYFPWLTGGWRAVRPDEPWLGRLSVRPNYSNTLGSCLPDPLGLPQLCVPRRVRLDA